MSRKLPSEASMQITIASWLEKNLPPSVVWNHFPAGGGGYRRGALLKRMGLKPGWPDLLFISGGKAFGIELKRPGGRLSKDQREKHRLLQAAGMQVAVAFSLAETASLLAAWGLLP